MKTFYGALVLFGALLVFALFANNYLKNTTDSLTAHTAKLEQHVQAKKWPEAAGSYNQLKTAWEKTNSRWAMLIDHQELDNINISMARLKQFMDTKQPAQALAELGELKLLLKHIPEKEALSIKNVL